MNRFINEKLDKAFKVVPLTSTDKRLKADSEMTPLNSRLTVAKIKGGIHEAIEEPAQDIGPDIEDLGTSSGADPEAIGKEMDQDAIDLDAEIPMDNELDNEQGEQIDSDDQGGATPSDSDYSIEQAHQQLGGIISNWMDMAGKYPEGESRHKFLEIGERLREIAGVIKRDYIETPADKAPQDTMEPEDNLDLGDDTGGEDLNAKMPEELPEGEDLNLNV